jgi:hypothetical protein
MDLKEFDGYTSGSNTLFVLAVSHDVIEGDCSVSVSAKVGKGGKVTLNSVQI